MARHRNPQRAPASAASPSLWIRALQAVVLLASLLTPIAISWRGADHFRLPKELVLIAAAVLASALCAAALVLRRIEWPADLRLPAGIAAAGLGWTAVSTLLSTNRTLSVNALVWGAAVCALFLVAVMALRQTERWLLAVALLVPGVVNAVLLLLQATRVWNPWTFEPEMPERLMLNALLGNPNDAGAYLAAVALFAFAMFLDSRRIVYALTALVASAALVASETLTAIAALALAFIVMLLMLRRRGAVVLALAGPLILIGALLFHPPTNQRVRAVARDARAGTWGTFLSARVPAFLAAWEMFRDAPLTGLGPGTYRYHYMAYFERVEQRYPRMVVGAPKGTMFVQTHNDHLQLLAETGLPGYLLLAGGVVVLAWRATRAGTRAARLLAWPTATLLLVLMAGTFPLQLAATVWTVAVMGAAALAWRSPDAEA